MTITSPVFDAFLKCPTKCFLLFHGESGAGSFYADWTRTQNEFYRTEGIKRLTGGLQPDEFGISPTPQESLKTGQWRFVLDLVAHGKDIESCLHAAERLPSKGRGKPVQFIPIRFFFNNKLTRDHKLLLAFDALVLSEMAGRQSGLGKIIHGEDYATLKVKTSTLTREVEKLTGGITTLLSSPSSPDLVLNRHCCECEFQARCRQKAVEKDDLSLLAGMKEEERKRHHGKGIFTVTQLSYTVTAPPKPHGSAGRLRSWRTPLASVTPQHFPLCAPVSTPLSSKSKLGFGRPTRTETSLSSFDQSSELYSRFKNIMHSAHQKVWNFIFPPIGDMGSFSQQTCR